jgi:hypothetical protein
VVGIRFLAFCLIAFGPVLLLLRGGLSHEAEEPGLWTERIPFCRSSWLYPVDDGALLSNTVALARSWRRNNILRLFFAAGFSPVVGAVPTKTRLKP